MKVVFCGTPEFAVPTLEAVIAAGHEVALVVTQPDRAAGRGEVGRQVSGLPGRSRRCRSRAIVRLHGGAKDNSPTDPVAVC